MFYASFAQFQISSTCTMVDMKKVKKSLSPKVLRSFFILTYIDLLPAFRNKGHLSVLGV